MNPRCNERGLGDGSGGKGFAVHVGGPEFDPLAMPSTVAWACNPSTGEVDTSTSLGTCSQSSLLGEYQAKKRLVSKTKVTDISKLRLSTNAYTHTCTVTQRSDRINIRKHKDDK